MRGILQVDPAGAVPIWKQIEEGVRRLVAAGRLEPGAPVPSVRELARDLQIHVVTADTFGTAKVALEDVKALLTLLPAEKQDEAKRAYVASLGSETCVCIGNGRNDRLMLKQAALSIAVLHMEGMATEAALASHLLVTSAQDAFDILLAPKRLIATLRS